MEVSRGTMLSSLTNKRFCGVVIIFLLFLSCGIHKPKFSIEDFVLVPNAKQTYGNSGLTAFVFENDKRILPFQQFAVSHFNLQTLNQREIPFVINEMHFTLHIYDADEIVKYINTADFVLKHQITDANKIGDQTDFIVLSVTNSMNEDCLNEQSLYQNIVTKYLKNLKEEYFRNDR